LACTLFGTPEVEVTDARLDGKRVFVTVRINSQQESILRDASGTPIGGRPGERADVIDIWTFLRDTADSTPATANRWLLAETRA
jgi:predicted lipid-binding transport protein (Tim44 family)